MITEKATALLAEGLAKFKDGDWDGAERACQTLAGQYPQHADALHLLGLIKFQRGDFESARSMIEQAIAENPDKPHYYNNLAITHLSLGSPQAAEYAAEKSTTLAPQDADAFTTYGIVLHHLKRHQEAESAYTKAISLKPDHSQAHINLGTLKIESRDFASAKLAFETAVRISPKSVDAAFGLGKSLIRLGLPDDAVQLLSKTVSESYDSKDVQLTLAEAHLRSNKPAAAYALLKDKVELYSGDSLFWNDLGHIQRDLGQHEDALESFERALSINPDNVNAAVNMGLTLLALGRFEEGWGYYQRRNLQPEIESNRPVLDTKPWPGDPLDGQNTIVWTEQGLGDEILQASLIPGLANVASQVTLLCSKRLVKLFQNSFPQIQVLEKETASGGSGISTSDVALPLLDTAQRLRNRLSSFPGDGGYLSAPENSVNEIQKRYHSPENESDPPFLIGLSWQSSHALYGSQNSIALKDWAPVFEAVRETERPVVFIPLQFGMDIVEVRNTAEACGVTIIDDPMIDQGGDFLEVAAQVAAMDLVISTSTTTAQLAGALGCPVWHLPSAGLACGWYWMAEGVTTPWHPSMRQFRRPREETGSQQISNVAKELKNLLEGPVEGKAARP